MSTLAQLNPLSALRSLFYPALCAACSESAGEGQYLCGNCQRRAPRITPPFCAKCSEQFSGAITQQFECANCEGRALHFDAAVSAYRSRGLVRELIHQFKYGRQRYLRHPLAAWLEETMHDPLHPARERERGFNQATLLAELLARRIAVPLRPALERLRYTTTQTAYDRTERMENLHDAFRLRKNANVRELRVLLIDDVLTTGSTLSECARVLRAAGAVSVHAATAARA